MCGSKTTTGMTREPQRGEQQTRLSGCRGFGLLTGLLSVLLLGGTVLAEWRAASEKSSSAWTWQPVAKEVPETQPTGESTIPTTVPEDSRVIFAGEDESAQRASASVATPSRERSGQSEWRDEVSQSQQSVIAPLIVFARNYSEPWLLPATECLSPPSDHWVTFAAPLAFSEEMALVDGSDLSHAPAHHSSGSAVDASENLRDEVIPLLGEESPYWTDSAEFSSAALTAQAVSTAEPPEVWAIHETEDGSNQVENLGVHIFSESNILGNHDEEYGLIDACCDESESHGRYRSCLTFGESARYGRHLSGHAGGRSAAVSQAGVGQRELSPLQALLPRLRARARQKNPWLNVLDAEHVPSAAHFPGSLHADPNVEWRTQDPDHNRIRLSTDVPVAKMTLKTQPSSGRMPAERTRESRDAEPALAHVPGTERGWDTLAVHWNAPQTTHAPLYFEEIALERSGYTRGYLQPLVSGIEFITTVPLLPGLMTLDPPLSTQYELGEIRPGTPTPYMGRQPEWTYHALAVEIAFVTGLAFLIP